MSEHSKIIGEIEIVCPRCGHNRSYKRMTCDLSAEFGECMACGELTYNNMFNQVSSQPTVRCPYCNSTNTKKISALSKAGNAALFGVFAISKNMKEWHCNNCKSDF